jgi:hypothetical protein
MYFFTLDDMSHLLREDRTAVDPDDVPESRRLEADEWETVGHGDPRIEGAHAAPAGQFFAAQPSVSPAAARGDSSTPTGE